jgi:hypothetical protein
LVYGHAHSRSYGPEHEGRSAWRSRQDRGSGYYVRRRQRSEQARNKRNSKNIGGMGKQIVHTLVERKGRARSNHIANISSKTLRPILVEQVSRKSSLMNDTAGGYMGVGKEFERHEMVDHGAG